LSDGVHRVDTRQGMVQSSEYRNTGEFAWTELTARASARCMRTVLSPFLGIHINRTLGSSGMAILGTTLRPFQPLQFLLRLLAGWINHRQLVTIDYARKRISCKERLGDRRHRCADAEGRRLARRACALRRKAASELDTLVTPDTLMRWYRALVTPKRTYAHRRGPGRPTDDPGHHPNQSRGTGDSRRILHVSEIKTVPVLFNIPNDLSAVIALVN
jgi:hypothetical protein